MSTDHRWSVCPNCKKRQEKEQAKPPTALENTLREDWEFFFGKYAGMDTQNVGFRIQYYAECYQCGWSYNYEHVDTNVFEKTLDRNAKG